MNTTRSPTSRAKCISCVTTSIVMPVAREVAHDDEHLADELRVERRGDLVEEHHVRLHHQRPRDRDPLLLAARELVRVLVGLLRRARRRRAARARALSASARGSFRIRRAASVRLSIAVRCGKRLNCWKTIPIRCRTAETSTPFARDLLALEEDPARLDRLEQVDAAQERALAAAARADDRRAPRPARRSRSIPSRTRLSPKLLRTPSSRSSGPDRPAPAVHRPLVDHAHAYTLLFRRGGSTCIVIG